MKHRIHITEEAHVKRAHMALDGLKRGDGEYEFFLGPYERNRSEEQKNYYFRVVGIIAPDLGWDKPSLHKHYKKAYLMPIFLADEKMVEYHQKVAEINQAYAARAITESLRDNLLDIVTSTKDAKMKHMREFIDDVQNHAAEYNIRLPVLERMQ